MRIHVPSERRTKRVGRFVHIGIYACVVVLAAGASLMGGCDREEDSPDTSGAKKNTEGISPQELVIFHAGSLSVPFRDVTELFKSKHPDVTIKAEAAGSRDTARKVSDLGRSCDVLGSADYKVVENLLMPDHADFNIRFVANEMCIAHTQHSRATDEINADNWHEVLLRDDVTFGRADPNRDPCGYRTVMVFQLAERHCRATGLAERLGSKHGGRFIRPKETDLLALLETGEIDYLFIYKSVATQHGLHTIALPREINLGDPSLAEVYGESRVQVTGKKPGELITRVGEPIVYSVTIPVAALDRTLAEQYLNLLLSPEGQAIMEKNGHRVLTPMIVDGANHLPDSLKPLFDK